MSSTLNKKTYVSMPLQSEGLARLPTVLSFLGISKTSFMNGVKTGKYPRPIKIGPRTSAWRVEDIRSLINQIGGKQ